MSSKERNIEITTMPDPEHHLPDEHDAHQARLDRLELERMEHVTRAQIMGTKVVQTVSDLASRQALLEIRDEMPEMVDDPQAVQQAALSLQERLQDEVEAWVGAQQDLAVTLIKTGRLQSRLAGESEDQGIN